MGERAHIAVIEPDGSGRYIYLGHGCYPDQAGKILLEHYGSEAQARELMTRGAIPELKRSVAATESYHEAYGSSWAEVQPVRFTGGTEAFFQRPYLPGPEWLYGWVNDGWLAAEVTTQPPRDWLDKLGTLPDDEFQAWFNHNRDPAWVEWRERARVNQMPRPLDDVIRRYATRRENGQPKEEQG